MLFIGIDPGLNRTGVGIIEGERNTIKYVAHKLIKTDPKASLIDRLHTIVRGVNELLDLYTPKFVGVEDIFFSNNPKTALQLGQVRGVIIATLLQRDIAIKEYTALQIKKAITGYGKADKDQVKKMVEIHLNLVALDRKVPLDITDALACAICLSYNVFSRVNYDI